MNFFAKEHAHREIGPLSSSNDATRTRMADNPYFPDVEPIVDVVQKKVIRMYYNIFLAGIILGIVMTNVRE